MKNLFPIVLLFLLSINLLSCKSSESGTTEQTKPQFRHDGYLEIHSESGEFKATFDIEIVTKENELARGLMFRESMEPNQGMLFVFEFVDYHSFWMQNTYLSLDMLFIDQNDTIVSIAPNTTPYSEEQIYPDKPNKYVLEILAGTANRLNIKETDKVSWRYKED
jgi:uncharacterized protein